MTSTTALSVSLTVPLMGVVPVAVAILVVSVVMLRVDVRVWLVPTAKLAIVPTMKSSLGLPGVPLSSLTVTLLRTTSPVLLTL